MPQTTVNGEVPGSSQSQIVEVINESAPGLTGWSQAIMDPDATTISEGTNGTLINLTPTEAGAINAILTHPTKIEAGQLAIEYHLRRATVGEGTTAYMALQQTNNSATKEVQAGVRRQSGADQALLAAVANGATSHYATRAETSLWLRLLVSGPRAGLYYATNEVGDRPSESDWIVFREMDLYLADMPIIPAQLQIAVGTYAGGTPNECEFEFSNLRVSAGGAPYVE